VTGFRPVTCATRGPARGHGGRHPRPHVPCTISQGKTERARSAKRIDHVARIANSPRRTAVINAASPGGVACRNGAGRGRHLGPRRTAVTGGVRMAITSSVPGQPAPGPTSPRTVSHKCRQPLAASGRQAPLPFLDRNIEPAVAMRSLSRPVCLAAGPITASFRQLAVAQYGKGPTTDHPGISITTSDPRPWKPAHRTLFGTLRCKGRTTAHCAARS